MSRQYVRLLFFVLCYVNSCFSRVDVILFSRVLSLDVVSVCYGLGVCVDVV